MAGERTPKPGQETGRGRLRQWLRRRAEQRARNRREREQFGNLDSTWIVPSGIYVDPDPPLPPDPDGFRKLLETAGRYTYDPATEEAARESLRKRFRDEPQE